ncbi:uncharacterized protein LOC126741161 [Anthonomus grandis grandis]|uniref:uncharacterized protein LOC126741161 n=1 Tax=Anthonomus grandis grandis TaxID=2921223 RepID=UPI002165BAAA|nr:uncharacterized protein LOC126741161 [Anthonomus grandis grandis]
MISRNIGSFYAGGGNEREGEREREEGRKHQKNFSIIKPRSNCTMSKMTRLQDLRLFKEPYIALFCCATGSILTETEKYYHRGRKVERRGRLHAHESIRHHQKEILHVWI